jgi:NAD(P)-dependent dehydrogenase (short-subunit alcohol dehydrogenase family)
MDIALVTGAGRGIGREVARQLTSQGYDVLVAARSSDAARVAAEEVGGTPVRLDVTSAEDLDAVAHLVAARGRLDVLINNAAAFPDWEETALTADLEAFETAWRTNLLGPWRLVQTLAPWLRRSGNPRVVNVTSGSGSHGDGQFGLGSQPGMATYAVTKAALGALTHKLSTELVSARVNAVDPGLTATAPGMEAMGARPVADGAASVVWAATLGPDGPTGGFFRDGQPHPW